VKILFELIRESKLKIKQIKDETALVEMDFKTVLQVASHLGIQIDESNKRTIAQNSAMHKYFQLVADTLNSAGLDIKKTLVADVDWSMISVKEIMWKRLQDALFNKTSTTNLTKHEVTKVYETMNRYLGQRYGVYVAFPSREVLEDI